MRVLLTPLGREWYAIDLPRVREIVPRPPVTTIPMTPPTVQGVFNLRGEIVPLFDVAALLGTSEGGPTAYVTVVDLTSGPAGLGSTAVPEWAELGAQVGDSDLPGSAGAYAVGEGAARFVTLLDLETLLSPQGGG
jgi:chemotaxis signal transduction protein